jgi:hypothetical protein
MIKIPKHPCISCVYYKECGSTARTMYCAGRKTRKELKLAEKLQKEMKKLEEA